jgi:hypothetical protein
VTTIPNPPGSAGGGGLSTAEVEVNKRLTHVFIGTLPTVVVLTPRSKVNKPAGGFALEAQEPRDPQTMRLIEPSTIPLPTVTLDGVQRETQFELLGEWDAQISVYDTFDVDGKRWEVVHLAFFNGWEQRALVSRFG